MTGSFLRSIEVRSVVTADEVRRLPPLAEPAGGRVSDARLPAGFRVVGGGE